MIAERSRAARSVRGRRIVLHRLPAVVGSSPDASARVGKGDPGVAPFHCTIERTGDRLVVQDLGSVGGTLVNGSCIRQSVLLPDDELGLGRTRFRVTYASNGDYESPAVVLESVAD